MSELLLAEGVFVTGFGYPVVPQGQARVRCQISAAHTRDDLDQALAAFGRSRRRGAWPDAVLRADMTLHLLAGSKFSRSCPLGPDLALPPPPMGGDGPLAAYINCHAASS